jgi:hypothetical protein
MQLQEKSIEKLAEYLSYIKTSGEHLLDMGQRHPRSVEDRGGQDRARHQAVQPQGYAHKHPHAREVAGHEKGLRVELDIARSSG